jgi:general secretion pathway protein D
MEIPSRLTAPSYRAALLATAGLVFPLSAGEPMGTPGMTSRAAPRASSAAAQRESAARYAAVEEAQMLLAQGDEAYQAGKFGDAVEAYAGARELLPDAAITAALRDAATERYALASIARARTLAKGGDVAAAKVAVEAVLAQAVAPDHLLARQALAELNDPIRNNPALTAEHAKDVDSVRKLLYTAEGAYNLGDFLQAKSLYEDVLKIDQFNSAARRGLERVARERANYQQAAYDHTRSEMLLGVDAAWELPVPLPKMDFGPGIDLPADGLGFVPVANKLNRILIPAINLEDASLSEALDLLRLRAAEFDNVEIDPARRGVNFALDIGGPDSPIGNEIRASRVTLALKNVPLGEVLRYLTEQTRTTFTTDDYSVIIRARGADSGEMLSRTYRVPPDFVSSLASAAGGGGGDAAPPDDPFAAPAMGAGGGLLARRVGPVEAFKTMGVTFPDGASANYNAGAGTLLVVNTATNLDIIDQVINSISQTEPVMIEVRVKILRVQETRLSELSFDWMLNPVGFGGSNWIPGTNPAYLSGGTQGNGGDLGDITVPFGQLERNPITAGNRSGNGAIAQNSIDGLLDGGRVSPVNRAPGIFQLSRVAPSASIQMMMRGLEQQKGVDTMATPAVTTRSGQAASIHVIREFIYPENYEPPELPNTVGEGGASPVTPATPVDFTKREDIGIVLEVLPTADADRRNVDISLSPSFVDFDGFINYGSPINSIGDPGLNGTPTQLQLTENAILMPVFSTMRTKTDVTVRDGSTLIFGGLMQNSIQDVQDQTPILGSIPLIGRLFQSKSRQPISTAIIFAVSVDLVDPGGRKFRDE